MSTSVFFIVIILRPELVFLGNLTWTMDFASSLLLVFGLMICCCYLVKVLSVSSGLDLAKIGLADGVINLELYFGQKNPLFFQRNLHWRLRRHHRYLQYYQPRIGVDLGFGLDLPDLRLVSEESSDVGEGGIGRSSGKGKWSVVAIGLFAVSSGQRWIGCFPKSSGRALRHIFSLLTVTRWVLGGFLGILE